MFLLPSILVGSALALIAGGDLSRLGAVRFSRAWVVLVALAIQFGLFSPASAGAPAGLVEGLHLATYGLLIWFAAANSGLRALIPIVTGTVLNAVAILVNGGRMPVSDAAARAAGVTSFQNVSPTADRLPFLGDVFAIPAGVPLANVFSLGDVLIALGVIFFIVLTSIDGTGPRTLDPDRLLDPLRVPAFRRIAAGKLLSHTGDWLTLAALIGWIYHDTGSTSGVAAFLLIRLAPPILGGGLASIVVDRFSKQRLLVRIEIVRGCAVGIALIGVVTDLRLLVFAAYAGSGILAALSSATAPALLPSLLRRDQLLSANAALGVAKDGAMAVGALTGGIALAFVGPAPALAADLLTFAGAVVFFSRVGPSVEGPAPVRAGDRSALGYLLRSRPLAMLVLSFGAATVATGLTNATLPRLLGTELHLGPGAYGFGIAALASGLVVGQAVIGFARMGDAAGRWIGTALVSMAGLFVLLGLSNHAATSLLIVAAIGVVDGTTEAVFETAIQCEADPRRYGAIFGLASAFMTTTMLGAVAIAPLANTLGSARHVVLGASFSLLVAAAIALARGRASVSPQQAVGVAPTPG